MSRDRAPCLPTPPSTSDGWNDDTARKPQAPSNTVLSGKFAMTLIRPSVQDAPKTEKIAKHAELMVKRNVLHTGSLRRRRSP
jgi:hypothetical protein